MKLGQVAVAFYPRITAKPCRCNSGIQTAYTGILRYWPLHFSVPEALFITTVLKDIIVCK